MTADARPLPPQLPLRHPQEIPMYMFLVFLNVVIAFVLLEIALTGLNWTGWRPNPDLEYAAQVAAGLLLLVVPGLVIVRQVQRAAVTGTMVQLSRSQFPDLHATAMDFAQKLGIPKPPAVFLANGNGTLNAFAAQSGTNQNYVVLSNELFVNLHRDNREGLRFILGHEMAHIRLSHVALWYQLSICFSGGLPILGATLSRLREYSCDRNGATLEPNGQLGLIMLTAGRYAHDQVVVPDLVLQGKELQGFWVEFGQLVRSHPWTVRRLWRLYQLGLFGPMPPSLEAQPRRP